MDHRPRLRDARAGRSREHPCSPTVQRVDGRTTVRLPHSARTRVEPAIAGAIRRLERVGLFSWSRRAIRFPASLSEAQAVVLTEMTELVTNHRRKVPVPRRTIRFLATLRRPAMIATIARELRVLD